VRITRRMDGSTHPPAKPIRIADLLETAGRNRTLLWGLIALGLLLRILQYASCPSIWLDEAMLLNNLMQAGYDRLLGTLENDQAAPLLFLAAEKFLADLTGGNEFAVRLIPLLASCALLPVGLAVARQLLPGAALAPAIALLAVSDPLITYAAEAKPYALDALLALAVILQALRLTRSPTPHRAAGLAALAVLAPWLSWGSCFVLAPTLVLLAWSARVRRCLPVVSILALGALGFIAGAVNIVGMSQEWGTIESIKQTWVRKDAFAPLPPTNLSELRWYPRQALRAMAMPGGFYLREVGVLLASLGSVWFVRRRAWPTLYLLLAPPALAMLASGLHLYPFRTRLLLYAGPGLTMLAASGLTYLLLVCGRPSRGRVTALLCPAFCAAAIATSVGFESARAFRHVACPRVHGELRQMVACLREHAAPDDLVYIHYAAGPAFSFYVHDPPWRIHHGIQARYEPQRYRADIESLQGEDDLWVLFTHGFVGPAGDEETLILGHLDRLGRRLQRIDYRGGRLYRYDLGSESGAPMRMHKP